MKITILDQTFVVLMKVLRFLQTFLEFFAKIWEKIYTYKHGEVFVGRISQKLEILLKIVQKAMETSYFMKVFIKYERKFDFQKLI